jgi:hypothetical protein
MNEVIINEKELILDNADYGKGWDICNKKLTIPSGFEFRNMKDVQGNLTNTYMGYLSCGNEVKAIPGGFEKGKGWHEIVKVL